LHTDNALVGDEFMRQIEPIAAYLPYQTCPGNHEHTYNFSNYNHRFSMHSQGQKEINNIFWSYNIGPVHFVAFSTELHYFTQYGTHQIQTQYNFLKKDLEEANKPENRAKHPWIITLGHRPLYAQFYINDLLINGNSSAGWPGFEKLFYDYGVDVQFYGHEHNYERLWPIYQNKTFNGTSDPHNVYKNPKAPVHIITGSAGNRELHTAIRKHREHFSAFIIEDYGFTHMKVFNRTHIHIQQLSEDKGGKVVDDFYIIKEKHGTEAWK
ncbi:PREDICTED: acid phosphatase type 7-like, partial [Rhagoletis zephyria]|uniref:acid phosphatase type 7-like n=1 Tax=Rhagoletis zephyria TaxID=28612 RepID=UPI0008113420